MLTSSLNSSEKILDMSHFFAPFHRFTPEAVTAVFPNTIRPLSTDLTEGGIDAPPFAGLFIQLAGVRLAHLRAPGTHTNRWQTIHCIVHYGLSHKVTGLCGGVVEVILIYDFLSVLDLLGLGSDGGHVQQMSARDIPLDLPHLIHVAN